MSRLWDLIRGRSSGSEKFPPPGATLHGNAIWFPDQFLLSSMPAYGRTVDKKLLLSVTAARQTYLQTRAQSAAADVKNYHSQACNPTLIAFQVIWFDDQCSAGLLVTWFLDHLVIWSRSSLVTWFLGSLDSE